MLDSDLEELGNLRAQQQGLNSQSQTSSILWLSGSLNQLAKLHNSGLLTKCLQGKRTTHVTAETNQLVGCTATQLLQLLRGELSSFDLASDPAKESFKSCYQVGRSVPLAITLSPLP